MKVVDDSGGDCRYRTVEMYCFVFKYHTDVAFDTSRAPFVEVYVVVVTGRQLTNAPLMVVTRQKTGFGELDPGLTPAGHSAVRQHVA